ncbi:MAG TPA: hypothetical protein VIM48_02135, partial [Chthoniobacterales bacterium]
MKSLFTSLALASLCAAAVLIQSGCTSTSTYAYGAPAPVVVGAPPPVVPTYAWVGAGYYGGTYYSSRTAYYNSSYYRGVNGGAAYY